MLTKPQMNRIVREYGNPPSVIRRAIAMMRRRGVGWKAARQAVFTVNAAHAGQNYDEACLLALTGGEREVKGGKG